MSDALDQRMLTIVKAPTTKVGKDKKSTYISMRASHNGAEEWYYVSEDCQQWDELQEGDTVNAAVKDWGSGREVKKMQRVTTAQPDAPAHKAQAVTSSEDAMSFWAAFKAICSNRPGDTPVQRLVMEARMAVALFNEGEPEETGDPNDIPF